MSAEAWRRIGSLSGSQARFVWQVWYFRYLHRCPRKLGDELGRIWRRWILRGRRDTFSTSGSICVAGVVLSVLGVLLSAPQARFVWQVWYFRYLHRCPRKLGDELGRMDGLSRGRRDTFSTSGSICVAGVTLSAPQAPFAWQAWHVQYLHRCLRNFGDELGLIDALHLFVAGGTLSALRARFAWCLCNFMYVCMYVCMSTAFNSIASFTSLFLLYTGLPDCI